METLKGIFYTILGSIATVLVTGYLQSSDKPRLEYIFDAVDFPIPEIPNFPYILAKTSENSSGYSRPTFLRLVISNKGINRSSPVEAKINSASIVFLCETTCLTPKVLQNKGDIYSIGEIYPNTEIIIYSIFRDYYTSISEPQITEDGRVIPEQPAELKGDVFGIAGFSIRNPFVSYLFVSISLISLFIMMVFFTLHICAIKNQNLYKYLYKRSELKRILSIFESTDKSGADEQQKNVAPSKGS